MRLVIIVLCLMASRAIAADWQYIATNGNAKTGNEISYDKASVVNNGDTQKVWLKFHGTGNNSKKPDSKQLWAIHCHERQYQILVLMNYDTDLAPYLTHAYTDIQPDSWIEDLLAAVCPKKS